MIQANCRSQLTAEDFTFITKALAGDEQNRVALSALLCDEEMRDDILDHEALFRTICTSDKLTAISTHLFFYVMIRHAFRDYQIADRDLADYVASMLAEFSGGRQAYNPLQSQKEYHYLVDIMLDAAETTSDMEAFLLRSHLGNYSLFLTGIFPDYINHQALYKRAPGFDYFEKMGRSSYYWASRHEFATRYGLVNILTALAEQFRLVRQALNCVSDDCLVTDIRPDDLDTILRRIFYGPGEELN